MASYDHRHAGVIEITWTRFGELCKELALAVVAYDPEIVVGIAKGGVLPAAVLASLLRREFYPIRLSRRHDDRVVRGRPALLTPMPEAIAGKRVIVLDDIAVTGETLQLAAQEALRLGATAAKTATLFVHGSSRRPDYFVLETDDLILNPWDYLVLESGRFVVHPEYQKELDEIGRGAQDDVEPRPPRGDRG
jgi:hypoxanthine phosphoribosyltransferase